MRRSEPLNRVLSLLRSLSNRSEGITLQQLAADLEVHPKTVRRALKALQAAGFSLEETVGAHGRKTWRIQTKEGLSQLSFTFDEALAIYLGRRLLTPLTGTTIWQAANNAFSKIRTCLGAHAISYLEGMTPKWHLTDFGTGDYSAKGEILDHLLIGLEDHKVTRIEYHSLRATEPVTYSVHPFALVCHRGSLYLVAFSESHNEPRTFKVDRLLSAQQTIYTFNMPAHFDLKEFMKGAFGIYVGNGEFEVKVRFRPAVARYVEESTWHASQKLTRQRDGSVIADFQLSDTKEFKAWVLSFGSLAEVLEPKSLRWELADELLKTYRSYVTDQNASVSQQLNPIPKEV